MNTYRVFTARMSLALHTSSSLERFERGNAIEIRNRIMFDFYPGLPHIYSELLHEWAWYKYFHKSKASENTAHEKENNNNNNNNNNNTSIIECVHTSLNKLSCRLALMVHGRIDTLLVNIHATIFALPALVL